MEIRMVFKDNWLLHNAEARKAAADALKALIEDMEKGTLSCEHSVVTIATKAGNNIGICMITPDD